MKVLIVEDDSEKLKSVANALLAAGLGMDQIETAQNSAQAKRALMTTRYDLLILDVSLPMSANTEAHPNGGLELLRSISRTNRYKKPRAIIGLTAYSELLSQVSADFANELWTLIQFDRDSDAWAAQIAAKINYLQSANDDSLELEYGCELCVVTALYDPEFKAVQRLPWSWTKRNINGDASQYWEGRFSRDGESKRVVAAYASSMGMTFSATLAMKMISAFRPKYIAMVGIAAGIKGKCALGDAIVADPCWDWGSGKFKESEGVTVFDSAPEQLTIDLFTKSRLQNLSHDSVVLERVRSNWQGDEVASVLRVHVAPMASGAAVLADREHALLIQRQHRKVIGIDMEAYAIYAAAQQCTSPRPLPLVIKGVVDFADPKKNDKHQAYAAYVSASVLRLFMEEY